MPRRCRSPTGRSTSVVSTFGVMFTPNQDRAAAELLRVCKSGGKIGLANWTPDGFIGQVFKTLGQVHAASGRREIPAAVGHARAARPRCSVPLATSIEIEPRHFNFRYRSAEHFLDVFKTYYGPMLKAFAALDETKQSGSEDRPARPHRAHEQSRRRHHGRAERVSGGCHYQAMRLSGRTRILQKLRLEHEEIPWAGSSPFSTD